MWSILMLKNIKWNNRLVNNRSSQDSVVKCVLWRSWRFLCFVVWKTADGVSSQADKGPIVFHMLQQQIPCFFNAGTSHAFYADMFICILFYFFIYTDQNYKRNTFDFSPIFHELN